MFGSFQEAIKILEDIKTRTKSDLGKAVLDQAIFCIEEAQSHAELEHAEYHNQFFKCQECQKLKPVEDLRQFFTYGKNKELCPVCEREHKINKYV